MGLTYNADLESIGFKIDTRYVKLNLSMDDYDYTQAKSLVFSLGFYLPL